MDDAPLRHTGWTQTSGAHALMLGYQRTRSVAMDRIAFNCLRHGRGLPAAGQSLLQFGVYTGGGLREWLLSADRHITGVSSFDGGMAIGFDSFEGMPSDAQQHLDRAHQHDRAWQPGGLNAAEHLGFHGWPALRENITANIGFPSRTRLVRGFFNESLSPARARLLGLTAPAWLVDIDADLYSSTVDALEFLVAARLLALGTFLYYDDISWETWNAVSANREAALEELLAHQQVSRRHGLRWRLLPRSPHEQTGGRHDESVPLHWRPLLVLEGCDVASACAPPSTGTRPCV